MTEADGSEAVIDELAAMRLVTAAIGLGFTGVRLWPNLAHRANGVRLLTSPTRGEHEWSVTTGIEFDPINALGFVLHLGR